MSVARVRPRRCAWGVVGLALLAGSCAARGFAPPSGGGEPAPEAAPLVAAALDRCEGVRSITAEAGLSGRVGGSRVRGRLQLGLNSDGGIRLEAVAPFGLLFVLAGTKSEASLVLARENEVLLATPPEDVLDALAGLKLEPAGLLRVLAGCPGRGEAGEPRRFGAALLQATRPDGTVLWVSGPAAQPSVRAARQDGLWIEYVERSTAGVPTDVRLRQTASPDRPAADIRLAVSQVETNVPLDAAAFQVTVPPGARRISLADLRRSGPLGR